MRFQNRCVGNWNWYMLLLFKMISDVGLKTILFEDRVLWFLEETRKALSLAETTKEDILKVSGLEPPLSRTSSVLHVKTGSATWRLWHCNDVLGSETEVVRGGSSGIRSDRCRKAAVTCGGCRRSRMFMCSSLWCRVSDAEGMRLSVEDLHVLLQSLSNRFNWTDVMIIDQYTRAGWGSRFNHRKLNLALRKRREYDLRLLCLKRQHLIRVLNGYDDVLEQGRYINGGTTSSSRNCLTSYTVKVGKWSNDYWSSWTTNVISHSGVSSTWEGSADLYYLYLLW